MLSPDSPSVRGLRAPLFEHMIQSLAGDCRHVVLDCGAARSGTISLLSEFRCRLLVLDLAAVLPSLEPLEDPAERRDFLAAHIESQDHEPGQLVFCWNLFNYLKPEDIRVLTDLLASRLAPDARLHALLEYSSPLMPATPGHWVPDDAGRLHSDQPEIEQIAAPRYSLRTLERLMPQFRPERSMLLANGLQEHLFRLRG